MAPRFSGSVSSGTTRSGSMRISWPMPPQVGQAPNGLLNENSRGSISEIVKPETGQANFDEKVMRRGRPLSSVSSANSTTAMPVGELERRLERIGEPRGDVGAHHDAVDHHVDVVLELLVEGRRLVDGVELRRRS